MASNRFALALLVVGLLLLPGPLYADAVADATAPERHRMSTGYVAEPIAAGNDSVLVERYAGRVSFRSERLAYRHVADDYRAPNRTRRTLDRAIREGTATASDADVAADLRALEGDYSLLSVDYERYYAFAVTGRGANATVRTSRADDAEIAAVVREKLVASYGDLPAAERATFREIRNATASEDAYDYRPWSDEPVPDPPIIERDGTYYAVSAASVTDEFGPSGGVLLGFAGTLAGVGCLLAAGCVRLVGRFRGD